MRHTPLLLGSFSATAGSLGAVIVIAMIAVSLVQPLHKASPVGTQTFFFGDGTGTNCTLILSPDGTFQFRWLGCLGEYGRNHGGFVLAGSRLRLKPLEPNSDGFGGTPTEFLLVPWGERRYLVPVGDIMGFCNAVNEGTEPREHPHGKYYLREGDEVKRVTGRPQLPVAWGEYLLDNSVSAHIVHFDPVEKTYVLDAGEASGLRAGMTLLARDVNRFEMVEIIRTNHTTSVAQTKYDSQPHVGDRLVTKWYTPGDCGDKTAPN